MTALSRVRAGGGGQVLGRCEMVRRTRPSDSPCTELVSIRRQRSTELDLLNKYEAHRLAERVAEAAQGDAVERRITELYTQAADQLGSDKAPVRLAGLYALERLAQDTSRLRQTIVNVLAPICECPTHCLQWRLTSTRWGRLAKSDCVNPRPGFVCIPQCPDQPRPMLSGKNGKSDLRPNLVSLALDRMTAASRRSAWPPRGRLPWGSRWSGRRPGPSRCRTRPCRGRGVGRRGGGSRAWRR